MEPIEQQPLVQQPGSFQPNLGESEFGERLEYSKPPYRDVLFAIIFIIHLIIVTVVGFYLWITQYSYIKDNDNINGLIYDSGISSTSIFVGILVVALCGILVALLWLIIMRRFAATIIKTMLFLNIAVWLTVAIIGIIYNETSLLIIGAIFAVIYILWTWCIWRNIAFSSALLSISSRITQKYGNFTIFLALAVIGFDILWLFLWGSAFSVYIIVESDPNAFVIFLFLLSLYWVFQVNQNISHTTTCGVTASWYFTTEIELIDHKPSLPAFKRTMTTSFGSVCFGSLLVAFLQALSAMIRMTQSRGHECIQCVCLCILDCIERMVEWFNKYAFAHCAIYGTSYITSASNTWTLMKSRGIMAVINDDLTEMAIFAGAIIGGCVCAVIGYFIGLAFSNDFAIVLAVYGFFIGLILCFTVLYTVHSSIICLFVCYSEDPSVMQMNHMWAYDRISNANPRFREIGNNRGGPQPNRRGPPQRPRDNGEAYQQTSNFV